MQMATITKFTKRLIEECNTIGSDVDTAEQYIALLVLDAFKAHNEYLFKHKKGEDFPKWKTYLCGLAFSEFYADGSSQEEYYYAAEKREMAIKILQNAGINLSLLSKYFANYGLAVC